MIKYQFISLQDLDISAKEAFLPFVIPEAKKNFLEPVNPDDFLLALAAYQNDTLVGFCFGEGIPILEQAFVRSLYVIDGMRKQGIGTKLLEQLTQEFLRRTITVIHFGFHTYDPFYDATIKILEKLHWKTPQIILERFHFTTTSFHPEWYLAQTPVLPSSFKISPWHFINEKHINAIKIMIKQNPLMQDVSPFDDPLPIEKTNSLVLKKKNKIVGWMITHRYDKNTIRYSAFYVDREIRGNGPSICLLKEAIKRQKASPIKQAFTEINYKRTPLYWRHFVKKRLAPNSTKIDATLNSYFYQEQKNGLLS